MQALILYCFGLCQTNVTVINSALSHWLELNTKIELDFISRDTEMSWSSHIYRGDCSREVETKGLFVIWRRFGGVLALHVLPTRRRRSDLYWIESYEWVYNRSNRNMAVGWPFFKQSDFQRATFTAMGCWSHPNIQLVWNIVEVMTAVMAWLLTDLRGL